MCVCVCMCCVYVKRDIHGGQFYPLLKKKKIQIDSLNSTNRTKNKRENAENERYLGRITGSVCSMWVCVVFKLHSTFSLCFCFVFFFSKKIINIRYFFFWMLFHHYFNSELYISYFLSVCVSCLQFWECVCLLSRRALKPLSVVCIVMCSCDLIYIPFFFLLFFF